MYFPSISTSLPKSSYVKNSLPQPDTDLSYSYRRYLLTRHNIANHSVHIYSKLSRLQTLWMYSIYSAITTYNKRMRGREEQNKMREENFEQLNKPGSLYKRIACQLPSVWSCCPAHRQSCQILVRVSQLTGKIHNIQFDCHLTDWDFYLQNVCLELILERACQISCQQTTIF